METTLNRIAPPEGPRAIDDLVAGLCRSCRALRQQNAALEALAQSRGDDAASYQLLATQAINALAAETTARQQLQGRYERLLGEYRSRLLELGGANVPVDRAA